MKTIAIFLFVIAASVAVAADEPVKVEVTRAQPGQVMTPARELSPMMLEITAAIEASRLRVADLKRNYEAAVGDDEAMAIMREVGRAKREVRVEMMRIQLRYARQDGNDELVAELEGIVEKMTAPPRKGVPIPRPDNHK